MVAFNIFKQDLKNSYRDIYKIVINIVLFLTISSVFLFFTQDVAGSGNNLVVFQVVVWIAMIFTIFYQSVDFLKSDYEDGTVEQMLLICYNFEIYVLMKILNFWLEFCLPIIISVFFIMIVIGFDYDIIISSIKVSIPATLAICSISFLCGCFNIASKRASLLAILALPMIAPIVMLAIKFNVQTSMLLSLFLLAVNTFSSAKIIKIVSQ